MRGEPTRAAIFDATEWRALCSAWALANFAAELMPRTIPDSWLANIEAAQGSLDRKMLQAIDAIMDAEAEREAQSAARDERTEKPYTWRSLFDSSETTE